MTSVRVGVCVCAFIMCVGVPTGNYAMSILLCTMRGLGPNRVLANA